MEHKGSVLAVDDDPLVLESLAGALGRLGYDVWQAVDGQSALILASEQQPDVILLDVRMPGMDGFEVCRRLREREDTRLIPVVFLTGHASPEAKIEGLRAGASDFLQKPADLAELEARVRNLAVSRRLTQDLDSAEKILFSIARMIEARDQSTGEHCERLERLAVAFGRKMDLRPEDLTTLRRGAYLHDIGKLGIPDAVLLKPGALTSEEWEIMRRHVEIGVEICSPLRSLRPVLPVIRHHHERWDGSGYPDGLAGEAIPFLARVFQVVDVFDALASERCYRPALGTEQALSLLEEETFQKRWWDPGIVGQFTGFVRQVGLETIVAREGGDGGFDAEDPAAGAQGEMAHPHHR